MTMTSFLVIALIAVIMWWLSRTPKANDDVRGVKPQTQSTPSQKRVRDDLSFVKQVVRRERNSQAEQHLAAKRSASRNIAQTDKMSGRDFEHFVADLYRDLGYSVEITPEAGDQGADVIATQDDGTRTAIQAKRYEGTVGNAAVQEVIAGRVFYHCQRAIVITNSTFTSSARALAKKDPAIDLIDRSGLSLLVARATERQRKQ